MSEIRSAKQQVVDALKASGLDAYGEVEGALNESTVWVEPGNPYIEAGEAKTFTDYTIRFKVSVVGGSVTRANGLASLEDLIEEVVLSLDGLCNLESVEEPGYVSIGNATHHAAVVTVTANLTFERGN